MWQHEHELAANIFLKEGRYSSYCFENFRSLIWRCTFGFFNSEIVKKKFRRYLFFFFLNVLWCLACMYVYVKLLESLELELADICEAFWVLETEPSQLLWKTIECS